MSDIGPVEHLFLLFGSRFEAAQCQALEQARTHDAEDAARDELLRQAAEALCDYDEVQSHDGECEMSGGRCRALSRAQYERNTKRRAAIAAIEALEVRG